MHYLYGIHAVKAALLSHAEGIELLYLLASRDDIRIQELLDLAQQRHIPVQRVTSAQLQQLLPDNPPHQGVVACCRQLPYFDENTLEHLCDELAPNALFLILDGVQDPQNLGACLRTANVMAVTAVIAPKNRASGLTTAAIKVSSGAAAITPFIQVTNLARSMRYLQQQGVWLYGADSEAANPLWQADCCRRLGIVLGGEGAGLRHLSRQQCDQLISIPQYGEVESLNVSVASAICLYEARRQQAQAVSVVK